MSTRAIRSTGSPQRSIRQLDVNGSEPDVIREDGRRAVVVAPYAYQRQVDVTGIGTGQNVGRDELAQHEHTVGVVIVLDPDADHSGSVQIIGRKGSDVLYPITVVARGEYVVVGVVSRPTAVARGVQARHREAEEEAVVGRITRRTVIVTVRLLVRTVRPGANAAGRRTSTRRLVLDGEETGFVDRIGYDQRLTAHVPTVLYGRHRNHEVFAHRTTENYGVTVVIRLVDAPAPGRHDARYVDRKAVSIVGCQEVRSVVITNGRFDDRHRNTAVGRRYDTGVQVEIRLAGR